MQNKPSPPKNATKHNIVHLKVSAPTKLKKFLRDHLGLTDARTKELIHLGCIYINNNRLRTNENVNLVTDDVQLTVDDSLRVHQNPRRFRTDLLKYPECLIAEYKDFIIVNKPSGLPVPPTVDNVQENLVQLLSNLRNEQLHVTHRLDIATSGLLFFARTKLAQKTFNELLAHRQIKKLYRAVVSGEYRGETLLTHYMEPSPKAPKKVSRHEHPGWAKCQLQILSQKYDPTTNQTELEIELLTGRTHQIRAQLACEGHPILGDYLYGSPHTLTPEYECIRLKSYFLSFKWDEKELAFKLDEH